MDVAGVWLRVSRRDIVQERFGWGALRPGAGARGGIFK